MMRQINCWNLDLKQRLRTLWRIAIRKDRLYCSQQHSTARLISSSISHSKKPVRIQANPDGITNDKLTQKMLKIAKEDQREAALLAVAAKYYKERTIIFFKTKK